MHVNPKKLGVGGLLAAFSAVLIILGSVLESSSLFFIAAASFCVGVVIREWGLALGVLFFIASTLVNIIVAPNKFYCLTYGAMGLYLLFREWYVGRCPDYTAMKLWAGKYLIFNLIYLPSCYFLKDMLFSIEIEGLLWIPVILGGQVLLLVYEEAYIYFQNRRWGKLRGRLLE
jgi:hypothetical protein